MIYLITDIDSAYDMNNEQCWGNVPIEHIERDLRDEIKGFGEIMNSKNDEIEYTNKEVMEFLQIYKNMRTFEANDLGKNNVWTDDRMNNSYMARWSRFEPRTSAEPPMKFEANTSNLPAQPKPSRIINGLYDNSKH